jgi:methionine-rich copper-binding protein CopC
MMGGMDPTAGPAPRRRSASVTARALLALVTTAWIVLGAAAPASGHANLVSASPADGSTVGVAPVKVVLRFDETIRPPSAVIVTGRDGTRVDRGATTVLGNTASVEVAVRDPGPYTVAYRVLSSDGHPVAAETTFVYRAGAAGGATPRTQSPPAGAAGAASSRTWWVVGGAVAALVVAAALMLVGRRHQPAASNTGADTTEPPRGRSRNQQ